MTDTGELGLFGLNLDNRDEALYTIVQDRGGLFSLPTRDTARTLVPQPIIEVEAGEAPSGLVAKLRENRSRPQDSRALSASASARLPASSPSLASRRSLAARNWGRSARPKG